MPELLTDSLPAGLTPAEVQQQRQRFGRNTVVNTRRSGLWSRLRRVLIEPMLVLLMLTAALYLIIGSHAEALTLLCATALVVGISLYQEARSDRALQALEALTQPRAQVRRNGQQREVPAEEVVVGDLLFVAEGEQVVADAVLVQANDLLTDESFLTGESMSVSKAADGAQLVYAGSSVVRGAGVGRWRPWAAVPGWAALAGLFSK
ncbi:cation-transporting P-type ATPase [Hymenobacter koreensis]|uniref:Cation-transporting P-type ATPase N-terminal domain-containing protein n=1 Tax=Hymenobacter koreensis TaxID=1084523 RepID=A0ABP8J6A3_9BACT